MNDKKDDKGPKAPDPQIVWAQQMETSTKRNLLRLFLESPPIPGPGGQEMRVSDVMMMVQLDRDIEGVSKVPPQGEIISPIPIDPSQYKDPVRMEVEVNDGIISFSDKEVPLAEVTIRIYKSDVLPTELDLSRLPPMQVR